MKKLLFALSAILIAIVSVTAVPLQSAKADDYLLDTYLVEISETEVKLPVPSIPDKWAYSVTLKDGETVLGESITAYLFEKTGDYTLVYKMHVNGSLTEILEKTVTLKVGDTKPPVIITDGYDKEYFVGDKLVIQTATVIDNVDGEMTATVTLVFNGSEQAIDSGEFTLKKKGDYTLTYQAVDSSGNEGILTYEFTVLPKNGIGTGAIIAIVAGGTLLIGVAVLSVILICKKKRAKQIKKEEE